MTIGNFYTHTPASGGKPKSMVVLLHGLGSNGRDLISLAPEWSKGLPDTVFVSPDAPLPCDMAPMGYQWFSLRDWTEGAMIEGAKKALPILQNFIESQLSLHNLSYADLALCGFSQGTMMSLFSMPRLPEKIAGVLGYSGALIGGSELAENEGFHRAPVHLIHGEADAVVPVMAWHYAKNALEKAGYAMTGHTSPWLPHSIDGHGIESGMDFLKSVLYQT